MISSSDNPSDTAMHPVLHRAPSLVATWGCKSKPSFYCHLPGDGMTQGCGLAKGPG